MYKIWFPPPSFLQSKSFVIVFLCQILSNAGKPRRKTISPYIRRSFPWINHSGIISQHIFHCFLLRPLPFGLSIRFTSFDFHNSLLLLFLILNFILNFLGAQFQLILHQLSEHPNGVLRVCPCSCYSPSFSTTI